MIAAEHADSLTDDERQQDSGKLLQQQQQLLRLRMSPHLGDNSTEILAECAIEHPFFVKEKGRS